MRPMARGIMVMRELQPGMMVDGRFRLEAFIGQGGMGAVWRASQEPLGRLVAIKVLRAEYSALPHLRRRFAREARAAASLCHEAIVSIFDFGTDEHGRMFLAMEHVDGFQLTEQVRQGMSVLEIVRLSRQLLAGLAHAHARGVVHRDLKPENVLLTGPSGQWRPKIVDFGIARLANDTLDARETDQDQVVGTPLYMSPEQASGERELSPRTDLYNLGFIMYELLAGEHPFEQGDPIAIMAKHVHDPVPPLVARVGLEVPDALWRVIQRALEKEPRARWDSAAQMSAALEAVEMMALHDEALQRRPVSLASAGQAQEVATRGDEAATQVELSEDAGALTRQDLPTGRLSEGQLQEGPRLAYWGRVPLVGRAEEGAQLMSLAREVRETGRGRVLLLHGETGVGKTRLGMWLKELLEEQGLFRGHIGVFSRGQGHGMRGVQEALESLFRARGLDRAALMARVRQRLIDWGGSGDELDVGALCDFLSPATASGPSALEAPGPGRLHALIVRALEVASASQPRLILLDDVQWAGPELADFLEDLAVELRYRRVPVLIAALVRTEDLSDEPGGLAERLSLLSRHEGESVARLTLGRMDDAQLRLFIKALLPCSRQVIDEIVERAAGNPLHATALLRYLSDTDLLVMQRGRWVARDLEAVRQAVPPGLADLFRVRLRQIEQRSPDGALALKLLVRFAVLGKRFSYEVVEALLRAEGDARLLEGLDARFDALLRQGFITEVVGRGEEWYTFHHGLLRDVLLKDALGPAQARRLHRLAAEAMITAYGVGAELRAAEIAQHWQAAREIRQAITWLWRAAQAARRSFQVRQALAAYTQCASLMESRLGIVHQQEAPRWALDEARFEQAQVSRDRYLRALARAGDLHEGLGEFDQAEAMYRRVVRMCGKPDATLPVDVLVPLSHVWLGLGHVAWQRGDFTAAHWAFERVQQVLEQADVAPDLAVSAQRGLARVAWHRGDYAQAEALARAGQTRAEALSDEDGQAECLWIRGEIARITGDGERARALYLQSLAIYQRAGIATGIARNVLSSAQLARYHRDFAQAQPLYEEALRRYEALGDRRGQALCYNGLGELARFEERLDEARQLYTRAVEIFRAIGAQYDVALSSTNLGLIAMRRRELERAEEHLRAARALIADEDFPYVLAGIEYNLALVKAMQGQDEESGDILRTVLDLNARVPMRDLDFAEPLERLGSLRARAGREDEAQALWQQAEVIYQALGLEEDVARVAGRRAGATS